MNSILDFLPFTLDCVKWAVITGFVFTLVTQLRTGLGSASRYIARKGAKSLIVEVRSNPPLVAILTSDACPVHHDHTLDIMRMRGECFRNDNVSRLSHVLTIEGKQCDRVRSITGTETITLHELLDRTA